MVYSRDNNKIHYNKKYFDWQKKAGWYGAQQDIWMYESFIKKTDNVLDFGCGGGYMLARLKCKLKYGVDINPLARSEALKNNIHVFENLSQLPRVKFDIIISHHTLEHLDNPAGVLQNLKNYLKKKGKLICVVPIDDWRIEKKVNIKDINQHLYTWSPLLLGNLFVHCGYKIKNVEIIERAWLPLSRYYYSFVPKLIYNFFSWFWSKVTFSRQIRVVAQASI